VRLVTVKWGSSQIACAHHSQHAVSRSLNMPLMQAPGTETYLDSHDTRESTSHRGHPISPAVNSSPRTIVREKTPPTISMRATIS
jgi:hypothetical protein